MRIPTQPSVMPLISNVQWVDPDFLVFVRDGTLLAQRFDLQRRTVVGDPIEIADQVRSSRSTARGNFATSRTGVLVYRSHLDDAELVWIDRSGKEIERVKDRADYTAVRLTEDGRGTGPRQSERSTAGRVRHLDH